MQEPGAKANRHLTILVPEAKHLAADEPVALRATSVTSRLLSGQKITCSACPSDNGYRTKLKQVRKKVTGGTLAGLLIMSVVKFFSKLNYGYFGYFDPI